MNRLAYFVGINRYPLINRDLLGCQSDAVLMKQCLGEHSDRSLNFEGHLLPDPKFEFANGQVTTDQLRDAVSNVFNRDRPLEVALFYFAGHGALGGTGMNRRGSYLMTSNCRKPEDGVPMVEVLDAANRCKSLHRIVILDCCFSGGMGDMPLLEDGYTMLKDGVSILAASRRDEPAIELGSKGGVFTGFVLAALAGGAADVLGGVTLASIYAYAEMRLQLAEQQPIFKSNVSRFVRLRNCQRVISLEDLKGGLAKFLSEDYDYPLDHSYVDDFDETKHVRTKPFDPEHKLIFRRFQEMRACRLLEPLGHKDMFWAAVHNLSCRLTPLGKLYWHANRIGRI